MSIATRLEEIVRQEIEQAGGMPPARLLGSTMLMRTGLDSLGFASLVVAMQKEFGIDPFGGNDEIIYPESFGDLLALYETDAARARPK
jgi:hypothetical protein